LRLEKLSNCCKFEIAKNQDFGIFSKVYISVIAIAFEKIKKMTGDVDVDVYEMHTKGF